MALLLGYDVGSSSIKASLIDSQTGKVIADATSPDKELEIIAQRVGFAEQHPQTWWQHVILATAMIKEKANLVPGDIKAIGISYQMHGLVVVDKQQQVLRPAIIWCDSRAVEIGEKAATDIGRDKCLKSLFNLPGNFTASKLKWVKDNEPDIYSKIDKAMLPGDFIAMKMTGEISTTTSGLSEGIMWDFEHDRLADFVLDNYGISKDLLPKVNPTFSNQGQLTAAAADELGLCKGIQITYRGGDQPNNALSLGVLAPGQVAVTAGTSGVVYGVSDKKDYDKQSRVNTFVHVNHSEKENRYGVLLCVNGTGILNSWLKHNFASDNISYEQMNEIAATVPIGSDGLVIHPYGNGAERTLGNKDIGAAVHGWNFNVHKKAHFLRASQEGIVFALNYGLEIMRSVGVKADNLRAGQANMFLSPLFAKAFATTADCVVELYNTDGAQGAARGAGIGAGIYKDYKEAFAGLECKQIIEPEKQARESYKNAYEKWLSYLMTMV
ncbi:MAG: carbohydrate kinase [Planctomycetes bacterium]|nr:carbohydrate kinase [Planctomycetota bacterium]